MSTKLEGMSRKLTTADDFTGKKAVDREGVNFGRVKHIHINPETLAVSGVTIHQGFRKDYFLPETFIEKFTDETLLLSTQPVRRAVIVVDIDGHKLGRVKKLNRNPTTKELESMTVSSGLLSSKIVPVTEISGIGDKIILKLKKVEFKAMP